MDERIQKMIDAYLPNPPDPTLEMSEYYFLQATAKGDRVIRVFALDILPLKDGTEYGIYQQRGSRMYRIDARGDGDRNRGVRMADLYDNYQDCKDQTHLLYDNWELLRRKQLEEDRI